MTRGNFTTWKLGLQSQTPPLPQKWGNCAFIYLMIAFQTDFRSLTKTFLSHKADKRLVFLLEKFTCTSMTNKELNYKLSKINALKRGEKVKSLLLFSRGIIKFLFICISPYKSQGHNPRAKLTFSITCSITTNCLYSSS